MTVFVYIVLCLIWGSTWLAIKLGLADAPPLWSATIRFALSIGILLVILRARRLRLPRFGRDWLIHAAPGILMYGISYAAVYSGEQHISSSLTAILFANFPIFVALLTYWLLPGDTIRWYTWPGMALGIGGVALISWHSLELSGDLFFGSALAVMASLASAVGVIFHRRHAARIDIVVAATIQMMYGLCVLLVGAIVTESFGDLRWTPKSIGSIVYLVVFGTVIGFLGYYWLMTRISVVSAAMIAFVTPLVATVIGVALFDESFSTPSMIGAAMILSSVLIVSWSRRQRPAALPAPEPE